MTKYSDLFPDPPALVKRKFFKNHGSAIPEVVPAGATYARISCIGCGGQSTENYGGGGAFARAVVPVTAGETLTVQVGDTSTASSDGDSFVKRGGTSLCYADRGRGNSSAGLASNSIGDVKRDGKNYSGSSYANRLGGECASDSTDFGSLGFGSRPATNGVLGAVPGGGGYQVYYDRYAPGYKRYHAGSGLVAIEYFDKNPGY